MLNTDVGYHFIRPLFECKNSARLSRILGIRHTGIYMQNWLMPAVIFFTEEWGKSHPLLHRPFLLGEPKASCHAPRRLSKVFPWLIRRRVRPGFLLDSFPSTLWVPSSPQATAAADYSFVPPLKISTLTSRRFGITAVISFKRFQNILVCFFASKGLTRRPWANIRLLPCFLAPLTWQACHWHSSNRFSSGSIDPF